MKYSLNISGGESEAINIPQGTDILRVSFSIFQNDKGFTDRSDRLFNTVCIEGKIRSETKQATKDILEWSKKTSKNDVYKSVEIKVYQESEVIRDYFMKNRYCTSYTECMDENIEGNGNRGAAAFGTFKLELRQRSDAIDTIKVDCN